MNSVESKLLIDRFPEIAKQWNYQKNKEYNINSISYGSKKKYYWICPECKSNYKSSVSNRTAGYNCPYCRGLKVNHTNSLSTVLPKIASQWHPEKNGDLTPHHVSKGYNKKVWWICKENHAWEKRVPDVVKGSGCPYCSNKKILIGYNDLWTTHPHIASMLKNPEDGNNHTHGSGKKVSWICNSCDRNLGEKHIRNVIGKGLGCPTCKNTGSFAERIMIYVLDQLNIDFETQKGFNWIKNRHYDFYIKSLNMIIEMHGEQHYKNSYKNGRSLDDEQKNDEYKKRLAKINGIKNYIVINCMISDFNFIQKEILSSDIINFIELRPLNWTDVFIKANHSMMAKICDIYNNENVTQNEIAKRLNISSSTVIRSLSAAASAGLCDYKPNSKRNKMISIEHMKKSVVQFSMEGDYIREFSSATDAGKSIGRKDGSSISACCNGRIKSSGGFKWEYKKVC